MGIFNNPAAAVPEELRTEHLVLRMLEPSYAELDYDALMESRTRLRSWSNSEWPADAFTLAENVDDLEMHEREHRDRQAFAFTVLNPDETRCEGCVYLRPLALALKHRDLVTAGEAPEADDLVAIAAFWVRDSALARDLDRELLAALRDWFRRDWPFSRVYVMSNEHMKRDQEIFADAGLIRAFSARSSQGTLHWHFWMESDT